MTEADEVRAVAQGNKAAFERLAERHLPIIMRYAMRMVNNEAVAEDIAQETLLTLWTRSQRFDASRSQLTTWLHTVAHNHCIDRWRRDQRVTYGVEHGVSSQDEAFLVTDDDVHRDGCEAATAVQLAVAALPFQQRQALVLTYYQELSNRDVAEIMGMTTRAVESLLVRARASVRRSLNVHGSNDE